MATQYIIPTSTTISITSTLPVVVVDVRTEFKDQLHADLDNVFYNLSEFAMNITYIYRNGESNTIPVIFDEESQVMDLESEVGVITTEPQFHCHSDKFLYNPDKGDSVVINNREFKVKEAMPDSTGVTVVTLLRD